MSKKIKVINPETDKPEIHSVQNASDLVQHLGWKYVCVVEVQDGVNRVTDPQTVINNSKQVAKYSTGSENDGSGEADDGANEPVVMTAAEVAALNKEAEAAKKDA